MEVFLEDFGVMLFIMLFNEVNIFDENHRTINLVFQFD